MPWAVDVVKTGWGGDPGSPYAGVPDRGRLHYVTSYVHIEIQEIDFIGNAPG